jgi:hypothetical protein
VIDRGYERTNQIDSDIDSDEYALLIYRLTMVVEIDRTASDVLTS